MLFGTTMKAQWNQYLTGQTSLIDEISVVNENIIWITDQNSTALSISTDGGNSWETKNFPAEIISSTVNGSPVGNISAVNGSTAFAINSSGTNEGVFKTTDSGITWARQSSAFNSTNSFPDLVYFWNENEGVVIGDGGTNPSFEIYTTSDGGNSWNEVSYDKLPTIPNSYTINSSAFYKVLGNSFFFETNNGQIMKSTDKGLTWTLINTPLTGIDYMSFDFKDVNNGLLSDYNYSTKTAILYSTTNGGATWNQIKTSTSENYSNLRYMSSQNAYISLSKYIGTGMSYSMDNGLTWVKNTSFQNMMLGQISSTPSGKLFLGGNRYIYSSTSINGVNISVEDAKITGLNSFDITYSVNPDPVSSQILSNYMVSYINNKIPESLDIQSVVLDATNKSIVHIQLQSDLPLNIITVNLGDIKDSNGVSVLNKEILLYNTAKTIQVNTAGTLLSLMTTDELANITDLKIAGTIDARDFKTMRDNMPGLKNLDLSGSIVSEYNGTEGTYSTAVTDYPANTTPRQAFYNNTNITSVVLPSSLTSIGRSSFNTCTGLSSINIPSTVTTIGYYAFYGCTGLVSVTLHTGLILIDYYAFDNCSLLNSITIPTTVNTIGNSAFSNCQLSSFNVPSSVTSIGDYAFLGSKAIITVDANNSTYSSADGILFDKNKTQLIYVPYTKTGAYEIPPKVTDIRSYAFYNCSGLTSVKIPTSVTTIEEWAFESCSGLTSILIPSSVSAINSYTFSGCSSLTSIYSNAVTPIDLSMSDSVFQYVNKSTCTLYVPFGSKISYQMAVEWEDFSNIVESSPTDLKTINSENLKLMSGKSFIRAEFDGNAQVEVYNLRGVMLKQTNATNAIIVNNLNTGLYIIKINGTAYKVVVE